MDGYLDLEPHPGLCSSVLVVTIPVLPEYLEKRVGWLDLPAPIKSSNCSSLLYYPSILKMHHPLHTLAIAACAGFLISTRDVGQQKHQFQSQSLTMDRLSALG